jgi:hypothetical protein
MSGVTRAMAAWNPAAMSAAPLAMSQGMSRALSERP